MCLLFLLRLYHLNFCRVFVLDACSSLAVYASNNPPLKDELWVGGLVEKTEPAHSVGHALSVPLTFGCQYSETGLFRTQKVRVRMDRRR